MKLPSALTTTAPLVGLLAVNVRASLSVSAAANDPVTRPVIESGFATVAVPVGAALAGLIETVTGTATDPPNPSVTVTANVSDLAAANAPDLAAPWRAAAVGV